MPRTGTTTCPACLRMSCSTPMSVSESQAIQPRQAKATRSDLRSHHCGKNDSRGQRVASASIEWARPGIAGIGSQLLLDAQELVVFGEPVGAREGAGLDLAAAGGHGEIGNGRILGLARAVRHHR